MAYVQDGKCGSCKNYEYKGENSKGYCSWYRSYYYPDDSCSHWELNPNTSSSSGGCFLTSACCEHKGLPDNCVELNALRVFRDNYLRNQDYGPGLIACYYEDAPRIVAAINAHAQKERIYEDIYNKILEIVALIENKDCERATIQYMLMVYKLDRISIDYAYVGL